MGGDSIQIPRFFVNKTDIDSGMIRISGEDVKHIKKVLRLVPGDEILVCDGAGMDYSARITTFDQDSVISSIISADKNHAEPGIDVTLFQGIPKSDKMDYIIQKSVELGIKRIVPVLTERTVVKFDDASDAVKKRTRWQRIASEAAKQCGRGYVPVLEMPLLLDEALNSMLNDGQGIMPYENEEKIGMKKCLETLKPGKIGLLIGPEGGFSQNEANRAVQMGIYTVTLGPRILRTETAGIAALSILMFELGDMGG